MRDYPEESWFTSSGILFHGFFAFFATCPGAVHWNRQQQCWKLQRVDSMTEHGWKCFLPTQTKLSLSLTLGQPARTAIANGKAWNCFQTKAALGRLFKQELPVNLFESWGFVGRKGFAVLKSIDRSKDLLTYLDMSLYMTYEGSVLGHSGVRHASVIWREDNFYFCLAAPISIRFSEPLCRLRLSHQCCRSLQVDGCRQWHFAADLERTREDWRNLHHRQGSSGVCVCVPERHFEQNSYEHHGASSWA